MRLNMTAKGLTAAGAVLTTAIGLSALLPTAPSAGATASAPSIITTNFVCNNGVCAIGPGDVGMPFAAGLIGTGGPPYSGPECNPYIMTLAGGSLPPGLQLGEPICEWEITGTPTKAGTYSFTVQIAPQPDGFGNPTGPAGTQQFTVTIGTGNADRLLVTAATYFPTRQSIQVNGYDVTYGATYTVYVTATGAKLGTITNRAPDNGGDGSFVGSFRTSTNFPTNLTVTDSLGSSVSIPVVRSTKY